MWCYRETIWASLEVQYFLPYNTRRDEDKIEKKKRYIELFSCQSQLTTRKYAKTLKEKKEKEKEREEFPIRRRNGCFWGFWVGSPGRNRINQLFAKKKKYLSLKKKQITDDDDDDNDNDDTSTSQLISCQCSAINLWLRHRITYYSTLFSTYNILFSSLSLLLLLLLFSLTPSLPLTRSLLSQLDRFTKQHVGRRTWLLTPQRCKSSYEFIYIHFSTTLPGKKKKRKIKRMKMISN